MIFLIRFIEVCMFFSNPRTLPNLRGVVFLCVLHEILRLFLDIVRDACIASVCMYLFLLLGVSAVFPYRSASGV